MSFGPLCWRRPENIFHLPHFFLALKKIARYAPRAQGEGEIKECAVNNLLIAWRVSRMKPATEVGFYASIEISDRSRPSRAALRVTQGRPSTSV